MQNFSFPTMTEAEIKSINLRAETHGKDFVPAIDLGLRIKGSNRMLLMFGLGRFYGYFVPADAPADEEPMQEELDGMEAISDRPKLRFNVESEDLGIEYTGFNLVIDYGAGGKSNIELFGNIKKVKIAEFHDGGSITLEFTFQASGVDDKTVGKLSGLLRHKVKFTALRSAEADGTQEHLPGTESKAGGKDSPFKYSASDTGGLVENATGRTATDLFVEGAAPADPKAAAKAAREAERAAKFPTAAKKAAAKKVPAKKAAAKKTAKK